MKKPTSFLLGLAFMALLCFQTTALPFLGSHSMKNSLIKAVAGSSGVVDIQTDTNSSRGFYVQADLGSYYDGSEEKSNATSIAPLTTTKMTISLTNNETILASRCLNFNSYDCAKYNCQLKPGQRDISYPNFMVSAKPAQAYIYLDHAYWTLTSAPFYLTQGCQSMSSGIGLSRSGVLGLGTDGDAKDDFKSSQKFAIYINPNLTSGKLLFNGDTSYTKSSNPMFTLEANSTWIVHISSGSIGTSSGAAGLDDTELVFDINSDAIGLPLPIYSLFLSYFSKNSGLSCNNDLYKPLCLIKDHLLLSDITIQIDGNSIRIPPKVYASPAEGYNSSYFRLNFKATYSILSGNNYVTPAFQNSVILDSNFMSYYFTVFDATSGSNKIHLYEAGSRSDLGEKNSWLAAIVAVAVVFLVIIGCFAKRRNTVNKETSTVGSPLVYSSPAENTGY